MSDEDWNLPELEIELLRQKNRELTRQVRAKKIQYWSLGGRYIRVDCIFASSLVRSMERIYVGEEQLQRPLAAFGGMWSSLDVYCDGGFFTSQEA